MLKKIWGFVKNPVYANYSKGSSRYKNRIFFSSLFWCLAIGIVLTMCTGLITHFFSMELGEHATEELFDKSIFLIFILVSIAAPVIEETLFRGPLVFFKNSPYFKYAFYISAILFGVIHISNFEFNPQVLLLAPLLVAPQIVIGVFLGYIRVKLGLLWSILLHAAYNTVLFLPMLFARLLDIPIE